MTNNNNPDEFDAPAPPGEKLPLDELIGELVLFTVHSVERDIDTAFGKTDAVKCDAAILTGGRKAEVFDNTLIFPRVLQSQLAPKVGGKVLGRVGQGVAKSGQSAPWRLDDPTDDDKTIARNYLTHVNKVEQPF